MPQSGKRNDKKRITGRAIPAESGIIRYFSSGRYLPGCARASPATTRYIAFT
jgi:hypothetical protein